MFTGYKDDTFTKDESPIEAVVPDRFFTVEAKETKDKEEGRLTFFSVKKDEMEKIVCKFKPNIYSTKTYPIDLYYWLRETEHFKNILDVLNNTTGNKGAVVLERKPLKINIVNASVKKEEGFRIDTEFIKRRRKELREFKERHGIE